MPKQKTTSTPYTRTMKLSIITINYNNAEGLKKTLASVAAQTYRDIEHIIIDGGSTDGSVDVIREYENTIKRSVTIEHSTIQVKWSSEPDRGIYDAMNKGVEIASGIRVVNALKRSELVEDKHSEADQPEGTGVENKVVSDYLYFLNSGDTFATPDVVQEMMKIFGGTDIIVGRVNKTYRGRVVGQTDLLSEKDMSLYNMYLRGINHQSALIRRELLMETPYDATVRLNADWEFFVQAIVLGGATTKFVNQIFANYDVAGLSSNTPEVRKERETILKNILPERIVRDYLAVTPFYYEVTRVEWLLEHPFWYKVYRAWATLGCKILGK